MLRAMIVDDERLARVALRRLLEERGDVEVVAEADSVASAARLLDELSPDVLFLDVQMPGGSGFDLFFQNDVHAKVVFCTAYEQYAVRAFEVNALDYLVKPVGPEQLERALRRLEPHVFGAATSAVKPEPPPLRLDDLVLLQEARSMKFTMVRDIVYIGAADDYTEVYLASGGSALVAITLQQWSTRLPAGDFVRIHRSTLVNLRHVDQVKCEDGEWHVLLHSLPQQLAVSRRLAKRMRTLLQVRR